MSDVENALFLKLTGDTSLMAMLAESKSVYSYRSPENAKLPVVILFEQTATPVYTFEGRVYVDCLFGVKGITKGATMRTVINIDTAIDAILGDTSLTLNGQTTLLCRRESSISPYVELTDGVRFNHAGGSYRIWTGVQT